jgi:D-alanine-D-alanine ligase
MVTLLHALGQDRVTQEMGREWLEVRGSANHNLGVFATRELAPNEVIWTGEGRPLTIVTEPWVRANWTERQLEDFDSYAYPLGPSIYATWAEHAEDWRPFNHSCDPNAWFDGLNLVARRAIQEGEEVTLHYRSFLIKHPPFDCACGSEKCVGRLDIASMQLPAEWDSHMFPGIAHCEKQAHAAKVIPHVLHDVSQTISLLAKY